jgi:hypothetical protein
LWIKRNLGSSIYCDHEIRDGQEFSHGGDESGHLGFAFGHEALVEGADGGIPPHGTDDRHIESGSDLGPSAAGHAFALEGATVPIYRRDTGHPQARRANSLTTENAEEQASKS